MSDAPMLPAGWVVTGNVICFFCKAPLVCHEDFEHKGDAPPGFTLSLRKIGAGSDAWACEVCQEEYTVPTLRDKYAHAKESA